MKKKRPQTPAASAKNNPSADKYQISRTLPDLRGSGTGRRTRSAVPLDPKQVKKLKKQQRKPWKKWLKRIVITLLVVLVAIAGWLGWKAYRNSGKLGTDLWSLFDNSKLKGEDRGHVNILLAGNSADDPGHGGAQLTDSIMLISINTKDNTATVLSIPRDLYVNIPDHGYAKINAAYVYGEQDGFKEAGYPEGGMGLLQKVVSEKFGVPIDYYALVNYTAFRDSVNAVGGIEVTINSKDPRGLYDPNAQLKLPNGKQKLNGQTALNLSRARGDGYGSYGFPQSDFDRSSNQRMMLLALRSKAQSAGVLGNPIKIGNLFDAGGNNVQTDLSLGNMRRLAKITNGITSENIRSASLNDANGVNLLKSYTGAGGQSALIPAAGLNDYSKIQAYLQSLMTAPATNTTSGQ